AVRSPAHGHFRAPLHLVFCSPGKHSVRKIRQITHIGNAGRLLRLGPRGTRVRSGTRGDVGGQDVVRVAVEILAGPVVTHRGTWVGVAGGDLDVPQVYASVQHGGDEGMAEHVRVRPSDG